MSTKTERKPAFEHWSVERYRDEMGLGPAGSPARSVLTHSGDRALRSRLRGGAFPTAARHMPGTLASGFPSEDQIHRDCAQWVFDHENEFPVLRWMMHVPNGGKRSRGEAGKMKAMGLRAGVSDWILPFRSPSGHYKGLAIELKSHVGPVSDEQEEFLHDATADGWLAVVARSREFFITTVEQWLKT